MGMYFLPLYNPGDYQRFQLYINKLQVMSWQGWSRRARRRTVYARWYFSFSIRRDAFRIQLGVGTECRSDSPWMTCSACKRLGVRCFAFAGNLVLACGVPVLANPQMCIAHDRCCSVRPCWALKYVRLEKPGEAKSEHGLRGWGSTSCRISVSLWVGMDVTGGRCRGRHICVHLHTYLATDSPFEVAIAAA